MAVGGWGSASSHDLRSSQGVMVAKVKASRRVARQSTAPAGFLIRRTARRNDKDCDGPELPSAGARRAFAQSLAVGRRFFAARFSLYMAASARAISASRASTESSDESTSTAPMLTSST